ncbi:MAG: NCS2 family permease, partial [Clostridia bacterium]
LGLTVPGFFDKIAFNFNIGQDFSDFWNINLAAVFKDGFNFDGYFATPGASVGGLILLFATTALAFCLVDMFDTVGTLYGACARGGLLTESGDVPNMNKAMLADAIATCTGAVVGVSTVTTFVESSAGIAEGGKTGLTSMVTALGFLIFMFLSPIATLVPFTATATALIYVGVLMMNGVKEIDWTSPDIALPAFLTVAMMSFTYNISFGIGFGILSYLLIKLFTGKIKDIKVGTVVVALLFLAMFLLTH